MNFKLINFVANGAIRRENWDDLFLAAFPNMIFAFFNAAGFTSFSPMVCSFPCFAIKYATSYDAVRIGLSMSTKPKTGKEHFYQIWLSSF